MLCGEVWGLWFHIGVAHSYDLMITQFLLQTRIRVCGYTDILCCHATKYNLLHCHIVTPSYVVIL